MLPRLSAGDQISCASRTALHPPARRHDHQATAAWLNSVGLRPCAAWAKRATAIPGTQTTIWRWNDLNGTSCINPARSISIPMAPASFQAHPAARSSSIRMNIHNDGRVLGIAGRQLAGSVAIRATGIHSRNHETLRVTNTPAASSCVPITRRIRLMAAWALRTTQDGR